MLAAESADTKQLILLADQTSQTNQLTSFPFYLFLRLRVLQQPSHNSKCKLTAANLWVALLIGANSCAWFQTAVVVTNMKNFPLSRGTVSGILKGYVGLSAAMYTVIYGAILNKSDSAFLLFLALGLPVICFCVMYFIRPCTPASGEDSSEHGHFLFTKGACILLAIYLLAVTIINDKFSLAKPISYTFFGIMVLFLLAPFAIPIKMTFFPASKKPVNSSEKLPFIEGASSIKEPLLEASPTTARSVPVTTTADCVASLAGDVLKESPSEPSTRIDMDEEIASEFDNLRASDEGLSDPRRVEKEESFLASTVLESEDDTESKYHMREHPLASFVESFVGGDNEASRMNILLALGFGARGLRRGEEFKFHEAVFKADFWLLWLVYFIGVGTGVTVLNNLAQIGFAQGEYDTSVLLALFAFFNFVGRLGGGVFSEHLVRSKNIPRTILMSMAQAVMVVTFLLYRSSLGATLYAATVLLGICYGVHSAVMTPVASELFGLKHVGVIYNFIQLGNPLGAALFSVLLAGNIYDAEAAKQGVSTCMGASCFGLTYLVLAGVCGLGVILGLILTIRIRPVYQRLYGSGSFYILQSSAT
ncbi:protein NUCLEAR FUSION DEFECTIVE 4 isoform X2 [Beta vulgaris subsp. vulgaris]|uniref:protein NUCLEAR FUSION DEFECTIVE 4 isoform X2 n=1 Tax=Beta vulgaris subsp. vulgaris TaxID=3555 RepID=UPI0009014476|nr:protein NUCLEAR FUSION DEFECTIVE 4 isoform X2 [Beta vulgaris subsp. vulgaris]